jgi:signal transduction histidine kinase
VQHADARCCSVKLDWDADNRLLLEIADDGCGLPIAPRTRVGLRSMRERAAELGGEFTIESPAAGGACVRVRLPAAAQAG